MNDIVNSVDDASRLVNEPTMLTHEQTQGMDQINKAVIHLGSVTQHHAVLVEETVTVSESMMQQSAQLHLAVEVFKLSRSAA